MTEESTTVETTEEVKDAAAAKTYTEAELQSIADKRVTEALKTARGKFENEKKEAERLASMTAEERYTEELKQREAALAEREKQVTMLENKNEASKILADKGISINLVDLVLAEDAETMKSRIDILEKEFNASVEQEIKKRLAGATPFKNGGSAEGMSKEDFRKLSLTEQQAIFRKDPELYKVFVPTPKS